MNASDAINKIKEMLGLEFSSVETSKEVEETTQENFATTDLQDGTKITNDKEGDFELGDKIYVVDEEGVLSSAPSGEHTLRDGYVVVLDEESTLIEIRVPESEDVADVVDEETSPEELSEQTEETSEFNFEDELKTIKSSIEEMLKLMEKQTEDFTSQVEEVKNDFESFKNQPQMGGINEKKNITQNFSDYRLGILNKHRK